MSEPSAVDPEESFIASLSSCHMLWFLSIAAKRGFIVNEYLDKARGTMGKNPEGRVAITSVTLSPQITFQGDNQPSPADIESMHHAAHDNCYIASSVKSEIHCNPIINEM
jgi:organic hydroperoxide reductase OsmC/OhrA